MPSETLLLGIAQIAVVIAGFTAVTSVLQPPGGAWSPALPQFVRTGALRTRSGKLLLVMGPAAFLLFGANALLFASVAVYALALCVQLSVAVVSFYTLVAAALS